MLSATKMSVQRVHKSIMPLIDSNTAHPDAGTFAEEASGMKRETAMRAQVQGAAATDQCKGQEAMHEGKVTYRQKNSRVEDWLRDVKLETETAGMALQVPPPSLSLVQCAKMM